MYERELFLLHVVVVVVDFFRIPLFHFIFILSHIRSA